MPNRRHIVRELGAVSQPGYTKEVKFPEATKGIMHLWGGGARGDVECSPDDGTTWCRLLKPNGQRGRYTLAGSRESFYFNVLPGHMRVFIDTADLTNGWIEGIREVA